MRCRAGDLAVILYSCHPENVGIIVRVLRPCIYGEGINNPRPGWWVKPSAPMTWHKSTDPTRAPWSVNVDEGTVADADMQPIRGAPIGETTKQLDKVKA